MKWPRTILGANILASTAVFLLTPGLWAFWAIAYLLAASLFAAITIR